MNNRKRFTKSERLAVYNKCNGHCAYCGCELELKDMQVDHIESVYNNPSLEGLNDIDNLLPACRSCNHKKSTFTVDGFREQIEKGLEVLERDSATYRNMLRFGLIEPKPHKVVFYFEKD